MMAAILLFVFHAAVGGIHGVGPAVVRTATEGEDDAAVGIVLGDETGVVAGLRAPAPSDSEAVTEELYGATGIGEVVAARVEYVAAIADGTGLGIDVEPEHARLLRTVAVAVVEERQRVAVIKRDVMLAVKALGLGLRVTVDAPEDVAGTFLAVDLHDGIQHTE